MTKKDPKSLYPRWGLFISFFLGDLLLTGTAVWIWWQGHRPLLMYEIIGIGCCLAIGGLFGSWPFVIMYKGWLQLTQTEHILNAIQTFQNLDKIAQQIELATNSWQYAHDNALKVAKNAEAIVKQIEEEHKRFIEFLKQAQNIEMVHLQLEVEKLRQAESLWLQVVLFILDHVHALFSAALRSGKQDLIQQIGKFRSVVVDATRRVGISVLIPNIGEAFDKERHALPDGMKPPEDMEAVILQVLAPGYTFQTRLVRPPLVLVGSKEELASLNTQADSNPSS